MKIEKIKKEKNCQYTLLFDDGSKVKTYDDVILKHKLIYETDVDSKLKNDIDDETTYYDIYTKIVRMISERLRSEYEIKVFMNKEDISLPNRISILERLKDNGMIDDLSYAKAYTNDKFHLYHYGPYKIKRDLDANCINLEYIDIALSQIPESDIKDYIHNFIDKKIKANKKDSTYILKHKIINTLVNNGYPKEMVVEELEKFTFQSDMAIKKEYDRLKTSLAKKYDGEGLEHQIVDRLYKRGFQADEINSFLENNKS